MYERSSIVRVLEYAPSSRPIEVWRDAAFWGVACSLSRRPRLGGEPPTTAAPQTSLVGAPAEGAPWSARVSAVTLADSACKRASFLKESRKRKEAQRLREPEGGKTVLPPRQKEACGGASGLLTGERSCIRGGGRRKGGAV